MMQWVKGYLASNSLVSAPYARMRIDLTRYSKGTYTVEIGDRNGARLAVCRVVTQ